MRGSEPHTIDLLVIGGHFGAGLHAVEVEHLVEREWARTVEDIPWRRTRKGLRMPDSGRRRLREFLEGAGVSIDSPDPGV